MKIKVESCWSGGDNYSFRLSLPDGRRYSVRGDDFSGDVRREAKRILECETGETRFTFAVH
jgi:hypothetical protein